MKFYFDFFKIIILLIIMSTYSYLDFSGFVYSKRFEKCLRKSRLMSTWLATATRTTPSHHLSYCCYYYYILSTNNNIYLLLKTSLDRSSQELLELSPEVQIDVCLASNDWEQLSYFTILIVVLSI